MIAKISATENLGGAIGYNFKKVEKGEASILLAQGLFQNKEGTYTMAEVFADMQAVIPEKRWYFIAPSIRIQMRNSPMKRLRRLPKNI